MSAWRHPGAEAAVGLCVTAALCLTATGVDFSSTSMAAARARGRPSDQPSAPAGPPARGRRADASVPATPGVPGAVTVPAVPARAPAVTDANAATGQVQTNSGGAAETASRRPGQHRRAGGTARGAVRAPGHIRGEVGKLVSRAGSAGSGVEAASRRGEQAVARSETAVHESSTPSGSSRRRRAGGGRPARGRSSSVSPRGRRAVAGGEGQRPRAVATAAAAAAVSLLGEAARVEASPAPVPSLSPVLVPQIAGIAAQARLGAARPGAGRHRPAAGRPAALGEPFAATAVGATAAAAPAEAPEGANPIVRQVAVHERRPVPKRGNFVSGFGKRIPLPIPVPDWSKPVILGLLLLALWFGVRAQVAAMRARRLERQRTALLRDLGAMQAALVPELPPRLEGLALSVAYQPAEGPAAGGDFYDVFVPHPGKVAIMLGDVSGHGHEALTHAALTRYTLRAYLQAGLEPRTALALAGRVLSDPAGERYSTVALAVYDTRAGTLSYSLAGHPPPMLLGESMPEPVTVSSSPPIGWGIPTGRRQTTVSLPPGTEACFFSDGLIEARRDGEQLGREHLAQVLAEIGPLPDAETLLERIGTAAQGVSDDMVACILTPPELASHPEHVHVEELEADMRALDRAGVRRFLAHCEVPPAEVDRALRRAAEIALSSGSALLRVELGPEGSSVSVTPPGSVRAWQTTPRRGAGVDQPLLEALAAG